MSSIFLVVLYCLLLPHLAALAATSLPAGPNSSLNFVPQASTLIEASIDQRSSLSSKGAAAKREHHLRHHQHDQPSMTTPTPTPTTTTSTTTGTLAAEAGPHVNPRAAAAAAAAAQVPRDEFNSTESIRFNIVDVESNLAPSKQQLSSLKNLLLRFDYHDCCPRWQNLTQSEPILDELKRKYNHKSKAPVAFRGPDLLAELTVTAANITYLSIDGQPGENERDKYYSFYDNVQYYLRLIKVAHNYLADQEARLGDSRSLGGGGGGGGAFNHGETDFTRKFHRQLKSLEFRAKQDPVLASFFGELLPRDGSSFNRNFEFYEDFLRATKFGQFYARNISMIRESVLVFDQICSHLMHIDLLGNLTRPSKQYEVIRRMSHELYQIRNDLIQQISIRVLSNRNDVQRIFARLNDFVESRPYIRMLGDQFSPNPPHFRDHVGRLTQLLDSYIGNNMTEVSFYNSLSELPEDFIMLGSSVAHYYETHERPQYSKFNADYFNQSANLQLNATAAAAADSLNKSSTSQKKPADARQSNLSLLTRLFN